MKVIKKKKKLSAVDGPSGEIEQGSNDFVCQCYSDLSPKIIFNSDKLENFCISGTPRIGKTFFIYYLLIQLIILEIGSFIAAT